MSEELTPEAATEQRAALMADAGFRQRAATGGAEWQQIATLDKIIGAARDAENEADEAEALRVQQPAAAGQRDGEEGDEEDPFTFDPPDSPAGYDLPTQFARERGLAVDSMAEIELRQSLHAAGVDGHMASLLYTAAITSASAERTDVQIEGERVTSEQALRRAWGTDYEANVGLASGEARRIFGALPRSITGGYDFETWIEQSGLGSNMVLIQQLHQRALARSRKA